MALEGIELTAMQALSPATPPARRSNQPAADNKLSAASPQASAGVPRHEMPDVKAQLETINRMLREQQSNLSFSVDETTGKTIVRVFRESTGELVRQIPSEEVLAIAASLERGEPIESVGFEAWS